MKKIVKLVLPIFAFAILALSLSACGKISGSSYRNDDDANAVLYFSGASECSISYNGQVIGKGTYKVEKKTITITGTINLPNGNQVGTVKLEIQDSKKTKLKDQTAGTGTWTKI